MQHPALSTMDHNVTCNILLLLCVCNPLQVMELCSGGELFDQIVSRGHFSEQDAVNIMRSLLDFVAFAHSKHIVHRWVQPV